MSPAPDKLEIYLCRTPEDLAVVHSVRFKVFVDEEKLHKTNADQLDEKDEASDHFLLLKNGVAIGTVRWYPPLCKLGRMAGFYEKIGYKAETEGTYYIEDGEPHIKMLKTVQLVQ
ncbi:hypothetical protein RQP46_000226 [Phenoliferia psychrophenolica]